MTFNLVMKEVIFSSIFFYVSGTVILTCVKSRFIVFNATFNNISVISWRSVLLVEETGEPGENH